MKESKKLEFKEKLTNTFLKTVSAYANYGSGKILFGVNDSGENVGVINPSQLCLDIENKINDSVTPCPEFTLSINEKTKVVTLSIMEGLHKPYFYKSKAYRRNDTSTVEVDRLELTRLILEGENLSFESMKSDNNNLTFNVLESKLVEQVGIKNITNDILKTLELCTVDGHYTVAGELISDCNSYSGIDIVKFGDGINIIKDREVYEKISVLEQYDKAIAVYRKYYQYDEIYASTRNTVELIPEVAFREVVANALVHRLWDVDTHIRVAMFDGKIEVMSPGGLPKGILEKEYLLGQLSIMRNPIIANVFFRLNIIERFGTGVARIREAYRNSTSKPIFEVFENSIKVVLPVMNYHQSFDESTMLVYNFVKGREMSSSEIVKNIGFGKTKVLNILSELSELGLVKIVGKGRGTKYIGI